LILFFLVLSKGGVSVIELLLLIRVFGNASCIQLSQLLSNSPFDGSVVFGLESIFEALENPSASGL
jgi:hypothetical protein